MVNPQKLPLSAKNLEELRGRIKANWIGILITVLLGAAIIWLTKDIYSMTQTVLPWLVNGVVVALVVLACTMCGNLIWKIRNCIQQGIKYREKIKVKSTERKTNHSYNSSTRTSSVTHSYRLVDDTHRVFHITLRQFYIASEISELFIEYYPFNEHQIISLYPLNENYYVEEMQWKGSLNEADFKANLLSHWQSAHHKDENNHNKPGQNDE